MSCVSSSLVFSSPPYTCPFYFKISYAPSFIFLHSPRNHLLSLSEAIALSFISFRLQLLFPFLKHLTLSFSRSAPVRLSLSLILSVSSHLALSLSHSHDLKPRSKNLDQSPLTPPLSLSLVLLSAQPSP